MNLSNDILIFILYLLALFGYCFSLGLDKKYRPIYIIFLLTLVVPYLMQLKSFEELLDFSVSTIIIGFLLSPIITWITYVIVFRKKLKFKFPMPNLEIIVISTFEEFVWRIIVLNQLIILTDRLFPFSFALIVSILVSSLVFTLGHKQKTTQNYIEMFLFTLIITIGYLFFPGSNIGLHIGRNCYIYTLKRRRE